ncbi:hypothetical protein C3B44_03265 [Corynebacterium yudongzhengii]|uniref:Acyl carrier protein n=1 Tax=Corynebacterium yudongzhengii TaxID=2080740 RepID=A0A2U1T7F2_9CORY|nr:acyl carrier protein [Corynebacterium yudongzhengii]AWB81493.1 hypothetical protein C3B44_03265 [Corynebacterium yudongzhengii]PWC01936.1 acyl carrier protein [Corynebacterium yudongzhengii]
MQLSDSLSQQLAQKFGQPTDDEDASSSSGAPQTMLGKVALRVEKLCGFPAADLRREHTADDVGLGSLGRIELAVRLEQELKVRIDDRVVEDLATFGELADYLEELTGETSA